MNKEEQHFNNAENPKLGISDVIPRFSNLSEDDRNGIHEVLFQMDILELEDDDKVEKYYNQLPDDIKKDGVRWGFQDSVVRDAMYVWFEKNVV